VTEGNEDRDDLVRCRADWRLSEGSLHANGRLNRRGLVAIPTHESELARGSFVSSDFNSTNPAGGNKLSTFDGHLDRVFACSHDLSEVKRLRV
jgi:histidinol phosphatase-like enzyme